MIPAEYQLFAKILLNFLQVGRRLGRITPDHPITGREIAERYNLKYQAEYTDADVRKAVNYIREEMKMGVGSNDKGYWFCINQAEYNETRTRLVERANNQLRAANGPMIRYSRLAQTVIEVFDAVEDHL